MRVGVDATAWDNRRGYGRFTRGVVTQLVEHDPGADYLLYVDGRRETASPLPARAAVQRVPLRGVGTDGASRSPADIVRLARAVRADAPDVVVFTSPYTWFPAGDRPTVVGIHDVIAHELPQLVLPRRRDRMRWFLKERLALRAATCVFTVSEASRQALATRLGRAVGSIGVVPEAPDRVFRPLEDGRQDLDLGPLGVSAGETYVLCAAGGISPHKNVEALVEAVSRLHTSVRLVIAGALDDEAYASSLDRVRRRAGELGLGDRLVFPGFVPDDVLAALYRQAALVVNPSLAEGFGLTAVEAAACGAPVALSDIAAHRETLGGAAVFFDPRDPPRLAAVIDDLLADAERRRRLGDACRDAVAGLTWQGAAARLRELVHEAGAGGRDG